MRGAVSRTALITGGAGFIGSNLAQRLLTEPDVNVRVFDNLSRRGAQHNLDWLQTLSEAPGRLEVVCGDVRDNAAVLAAVRGATEIYHLAAQVAVTTSLNDPAADFEINARGTVNVLEAARASGRNPFFLYTSTNKVYGSLGHVAVEAEGSHYKASDAKFQGVNEEEYLDFHSPYGCSKGAADQYVRDYARIYGLPAVVFRMSCIAGPRQFGNEDQGWVAHFLYSMLMGSRINIYGDGLQVRDVLHVDDLLDAMMLARVKSSRTRGEIYNLGGGMTRVLSVLELVRAIEERTGKLLPVEYSKVRSGDQPLYISDTSKLERHTGWKARRSVQKVLDDLHAFWLENRIAIAAQSKLAMHAEATLEVQEVA